ncbi:response regulator [Dongshaea marina]|uniref:response regulator n=1 Tax=Dongshaea marina TaxID=2047966 RepID=UPI00131F3001|nr:response regulator [Dongshaea marina]
MAQEKLLGFGLDVDVVSSGREAIDAVSQGGIDLVLMDCHMPLMDGFQATMAIRENERARGDEQLIPIIALTSNVFEGSGNAALPRV